MKLGEVNPDSTQARFFKGEMAYGLSDAFASVTCWGADGNFFNFEIEKIGKQYHLQETQGLPRNKLRNYPFCD